MKYLITFRNLEVYKLSWQLAKEIFTTSGKFPREEMFSLTDQIRKSSRLIGSQIANAWGKRKYEKYFLNKLADADAEQLETQHWIEIALDRSYISVDIANCLLGQCSTIGKKLNSMMSKSATFCTETSIE